MFLSPCTSRMVVSASVNHDLPVERVRYFGNIRDAMPVFVSSAVNLGGDNGDYGAMPMMPIMTSVWWLPCRAERIAWHWFAG